MKPECSIPRRPLLAAGVVVATGMAAPSLAQLSFGPPTIYPGTNPGYDRGVVAADLNGDGDIDLAGVATGSTQGYVVIRPNNGTGVLGAGAAYAAHTQPCSIAAGDLDGDGDVDLAVTGSAVFDAGVMLNDGLGVFSAGPAWGAGEGISVAVGDLDGDGDLDVASAGWNFRVYLARNNGNGTFDPPLPLSILGQPRSIALGDLDGDGDADVVTANGYAYAGNDLSVLINTGNFTFAPAVGYAAGAHPWSVCIADFDGDGDRDLAVANAAAPPSPTGPTTPTVSVHLNTGSGVFAPGVHYDAGAQPMSLVAADLDLDGDQDLAVANCNRCLDPFAPNAGGSSVGVLLNDGAARFAPPVFVAAGPPDAAYGGPWNVLAPDLDGDGLRDLVTADSTHDAAFSPALTVSAMINSSPDACYPDCNKDSQLTVADFGCFQTKFVIGDPYADCNANGSLTVADFGCFQTKFVVGCP